MFKKKKHARGRQEKRDRDVARKSSPFSFAPQTPLKITIQYNRHSHRPSRKHTLTNTGITLSRTAVITAL